MKDSRFRGVTESRAQAFRVEVTTTVFLGKDLPRRGPLPRYRTGIRLRVLVAVLQPGPGIPRSSSNTEALQAETIVQDGSADMVALARAMLWNPRWPWHAAAALGASVAAPAQYWRSEPRTARGVFTNTQIDQR